MASLTSANDEIDEDQKEDPDFDLDEEVAETGDADEPQPKRGRISSLDKIKELNSKLKKKTPAKAPKKPKEPKVNPKHVEGKTIEQHRRGFGNVVRNHFHSFLLKVGIICITSKFPGDADETMFAVCTILNCENKVVFTKSFQAPAGINWNMYLIFVKWNDTIIS